MADDEPEPERRPVRERMRSRAGWSDAAGYTISDLTMLRKELVIGFVVAGFATVLVPTGVWQSLFLTGHGFWSSLENVAARAAAGDPGVRLLDRQRPAGRRSVGRGDQLRWGDRVRLRRPDHPAAAADLPQATTAAG